MTVDVTKEDIKVGDVCSCHHCPIARAVHRALGSGDHVVRVTRFSLVINGVEWWVPPEWGTWQQDAFDGLPVHPVTFEVHPC